MADGAALKGLRLLTITRGPEGYGFHMYTNKTLKGQYIKWVSPSGPADLAGMLPGDHVLQVDGVNVEAEPHQKVVELIRKGEGRDRKVLVIDQKTEKEIRERGDDIVPSDAVVMIPRTNTPSAPLGTAPWPPPSIPAPVRKPRSLSPGSDETDGPISPTHPGSTSRGSGVKRSERNRVKQRDWRASIEAYNQL